MPLKLNVGLSKKIGQPDFGSLGATCNFEVELEHSLVREPDQLRDKIRYLFGLAKEAVEEELRGQVVEDCPDLLARIDLLVNDGDALSLVDLKTARSRMKGGAMGARTKLNAASVNGSLLLAGVVGVWMQSWTVFIVLFAVLMALSLHSGDIRTSPGRR